MLCACGCGKRTSNSDNKYLIGHRTETCERCSDIYKPKPRSTGKLCDSCRLCACGCGKKVSRPEYRYARNHAPRTCVTCGVTYQGKGKQEKCADCRLPPCACGCGERVKYPHFKYLIGHASRGRQKSRTLQRTCARCGKAFMAANGSRPSRYCPACVAPHLCACGCGQMTKTPGADRLRGHGESKQYRQTKPEALLHAALGPDWLYVGCDRLLDGSRNPDAHHVYGKLIYPDIIHRTERIMVMVDGCYWHDCPQHGSGRRAYVRQRDARKKATAEAAGWAVLRVWEHEVKNDVAAIVRRMHAAARVAA